MLNEALKKRIEGHCAKTPGAWQFILAYGMLCHAIDDIVDNDPKVTDRSAHVLDCWQLALDVYSCPFYHANIYWLYPICKNIHRVYQDSVAWEHSTVAWRAEYADKLRCCGNEIILAVLVHACHVGYEEIRDLSLAIRDDSWKNHHDCQGNPI